MKSTDCLTLVMSVTVAVVLAGLLFAAVGPDLALATDTTTWGGGGGNPFRDECPNGSYLVGLKGRAGEWVDRIAPICAPWIQKSQTFGKQFLGQVHGTSRGGVEREQTCWGFGINNRAIQSWTLTRLTSGNHFVRYIMVNCMSLAPPTATARFSFGGPITADQGTTVFDELGTQRPDAPRYRACPAGEVAIGIHGSAGLYLDQIGLICGPPPSRLIPPTTSVNPLAVAPPPPPATTRMSGVTAPVPADDMFTIIKPANNDRVQLGQLVVKATPPKVGATSVTVLELKWLDAPPGQPPFSTLAVETPKLLQGYPIDQQMTQGRPGRWEVRARIAAQPTPGPWSFPVQFQLFQTQPMQSQQQVPQPFQQAPLPSSSVTQPPAPSSNATTQMRRSPSMIMPRGVEEKGGPEGNQTVDMTPEPEKKP